MKTDRMIIIDEIKGIAILSVLLFHLGWLRYGYLGVDAFLIIAGYLSARSVSSAKGRGVFSAKEFLIRRVRRLMPIVIVVVFVALTMGAVFMLPDDLENLSQSVIASLAFANNILCSISSGNYWAPRNDFLPLLHFWYLGVLMQLYVVYIFIERLTVRRSRNFRIGILSVLVLLSGLCEIPGLLPLPIRFYWPIARFWEFGLGVLLFDSGVKLTGRSLHMPCIASAGKASLSIYAWHYVLLAFLRYVISPEMNPIMFLVFVASLTILSLLTYRLVEMSTAKWLTDGKLFLVSVLPPFALMLAVALYIWCSAGIVRNVPELDVMVTNRERGLHNKYNDRIMKYRGDFTDDGRIKVLIVGNSYARDFANVIQESSVSNSVSISYCRQGENVADDVNDRDDKADVIFLAGVYIEKLSPRLRAFYKGDIAAGGNKTYFVGDKFFGESNGSIYNRRFFDGYYAQKIKVPESIVERNKAQAKQFGSWFVDMLNVVARDDGCVAVFTDDHKLISQDCKHLTRAGAQYYARRLDIRALLGNACSKKMDLKD